jgi:hypothetical protein
MRGILVAVLVVGCHKADDCERADKRLAELRGSQRFQRFGPCRIDDPAVRCALDNENDDDARTCLRRLFERSVHPGSDARGSGVNPLLAP